ncbi:MAG: hypothetical protein KGS48_13975 [Bacteroidetes bacterium]|nr:hypothetical protein [Bacteroidota bacterium]
MFFAYILLQSTFQQDLPVGLALCIVPAIIGWLAAYSFYNVGKLRTQVSTLTAENGTLTEKVNKQAEELTDLRVKLTQAEAQIDNLNEQLRKAKNDLIICESERAMMKEKMAAGNATPAAAPQPDSITFAGVKYKWDDLKIVEGIGPKIAEILNNAGINSWKALSETAPERIREILDAAGPNFNVHEPATWPEQARLANAADWEALKKMQDELDGGRPDND